MFMERHMYYSSCEHANMGLGSLSEVFVNVFRLSNETSRSYIYLLTLTYFVVT